MTKKISKAPPKANQADMGTELAGIRARLRIIASIERGYGVVPVFEEGSALLRPGEVAVYKEEAPVELEPGLYCLERQRPVAGSPFPESARIIEREVVYARNHDRVADSWEYISLLSKVIRGVRRYAAPQGPYYNACRSSMLLGPIVGIFMPSACVEGN